MLVVLPPEGSSRSPLPSSPLFFTSPLRITCSSCQLMLTVCALSGQTGAVAARICTGQISRKEEQ